jgi:hypothetical protein
VRISGVSLYRIASVVARKSNYSIQNVQLEAEPEQHLSVAIISLKIAFLKGTVRCFSRRYGKLSVQCKLEVCIGSDWTFIIRQLPNV